MSLDFTLIDPSTKEEIYATNITHNLTEMAKECGLYNVLWRGSGVADNNIKTIRLGLCKLVSDPIYFKTFNPPNNWGDYNAFVLFVMGILEMCMQYPTSEIKVDI